MNGVKQQINVNQDNTTPIKCDECGCEIFTQGVMLRKMSAILSPTGKEEVFDLPVLICHQCKTPLMLMGG